MSKKQREDLQRLGLVILLGGIAVICALINHFGK